ncbi:MAG: RNA 2',3'-cyclic phosphodiesterase [Spirochaetaceae bacterium]|nr:MAG: RNA 2',3'-cyclic phosphodiesterase [Spirochaetaceae bacterium]
MERKRLFLAVNPPAEVCQQIAAATRAALEAASAADHTAQKEERAASPHKRGPLPIRLIAQQNLHITLVFLGDTPVNRIAAIQSAVALCTERCAPFDLALAPPGCFPSIRRPRVVWVGVDDAQQKLAALHADICDELRRAGFAVEQRPFRAHITVGYVKRGARNPADSVQTFLQRAGEELQLQPVRFSARALWLIESSLEQSGAQHRGVWAQPLGGKHKKAPSRRGGGG